MYDIYSKSDTLGLFVSIRYATAQVIKINKNVDFLQNASVCDRRPRKQAQFEN